jgi:hypothetical protein
MYKILQNETMRDHKISINKVQNRVKQGDISVFCD